MPSILKESAAPYLLVLMVTLVGWMFDSAIDNAKNLRVIEFRTDRGKDGSVDTLTFHIRNESMIQAVNFGRFSFSCPVEASGGASVVASCLVEMPAVGARAQFLGSTNFGIVSPIVPQDISAIADARIPPGSEVAYRFGVKDKATELHFRYVLSKEDIAGENSNLQVKIVDRDKPSSTGIFGWVEDLTLFVVSNYLSVLVLVILLLLALVAIWILAAFLIAALIRKPAPPKEPEQYKVEVTCKGESHVATIQGS